MSGASPEPNAESPRLASIRRELARLCRSRRTRSSVFTRGRPCQWQPTKTLIPGCPDVFSEDSSWEFVADLLDAGHPIEEIELKKPPGKRGYVMQCPVKDRRPIYIKLQLGSGQVFGRSFHDSKYGYEEDE